MKKMEQLFEDAGWKKAPDFTSKQMEGIEESFIAEPVNGLIFCPFGFKGDLDNKDQIKNESNIKNGLKLNCPVHGDNCPGLKKLLSG